MRKISFFSLLALGVVLAPVSTFAFVPIICDLCTIGVVAGLAISRYLWVDDSVVGVWIGAVLVALIVMTNGALEKKNIKFQFRDTIIALSYVAFTIISFWYAWVIGLHRNTFFSTTSIFGDKILVSSIVWGIVLVGASMLYQKLKARNGGHAHFPFEKVALPIVSLIITSGIFYFITQK